METPTPHEQRLAQMLRDSLANDVLFVMGLQEQNARYVRATVEWTHDQTHEDVTFIVGEYDRKQDDGTILYWLQPTQVRVGFSNRDVLNPRITEDAWRIVYIIDEDYKR